MFEFLIGTRFYYKNKLVEVKENLHSEPCSDCVFKPIRNNLYCKQNCDPDDRHDKKFVIFKEVKNEREQDCLAQISTGEAEER